LEKERNAVVWGFCVLLCYVIIAQIFREAQRNSSDSLYHCKNLFRVYLMGGITGTRANHFCLYLCACVYVHDYLEKDFQVSFSFIECRNYLENKSLAWFCSWNFSSAE
jgi:hypothetical protein